MSDFSLILVLKTNKIKICIDMAKIQIKSEKITPFGGIFPIMDEFNRVLSGIVDSTLGFRCKLFGYQYSEIIRSLMCVYFCGGTCIEDLSKHIIPCVSQHPKLRTCSSDTILRAIEELTEDNISYTSDNGKTYEFNKAEKLNTLLFKRAPIHDAFRVLPGQLAPDVKVILNWPRGCWLESKITTRFWIITILMAALAIITLKIR